jgi:hypothetical protein
MRPPENHPPACFKPSGLIVFSLIIVAIIVMSLQSALRRLPQLRRRWMQVFDDPEIEKPYCSLPLGDYADLCC